MKFYFYLLKRTKLFRENDCSDRDMVISETWQCENQASDNNKFIHWCFKVKSSVHESEWRAGKTFIDLAETSKRCNAVQNCHSRQLANKGTNMNKQWSGLRQFYWTCNGPCNAPMSSNGLAWKNIFIWEKQLESTCKITLLKALPFISNRKLGKAQWRGENSDRIVAETEAHSCAFSSSAETEFRALLTKQMHQNKK